jgi:hypothetical protein
MRAENEHFIDDDEWRDQFVPPRDSDGEWETIASGVQRLRFAGNDPVRNIVTGRRNMKVGGFFSYKMGAHVDHEGDHEGMLAALFEVHPLIKAFWGQPESLKINLDGDIIKEADETSSIIYTTDFLTIIAAQELRWEFKMLSDLRPPPPKSPDDHRGWNKWEDAKKLRQRLRIVRQAYRDAGLIWVLFTDADLLAMANSQTVGEIVASGGTDIEEEDKALRGASCRETRCHSGRR